MTFSLILKRLKSIPWLPGLFSLLAGLAYAVQGVYYAHGLDVTMDEGTYLMKGLLYVRGAYAPFEPYGPLTNKSPLAFFILGLPQALFEPGLRTGRYFGVFLGLVILAGTWLAARRLGGRWWAAGATWALASNPAGVVFYTLAASQAPAAALIVWALALTLGKERRGWELVLGSALAALAPMARQNLIPLTGLVWLYLIWEHGWRRGLPAALAGAGVLVAFNAFYWPAILDTIWRPLLPGFFRWILPPSTVSSGGGVSNWTQNYDDLSRLYVFWEGLRFHFAAMFGALAVWIFWPGRKGWRNESRMKAAVMLSTTLLVLTAEHYYAAAGMNYCLFCYSGYLAFFSPAGLMLAAAVGPSLARRGGWMRQALAMLLTIAGSAGIGFGAYQELHKALLVIPVPRIKGMRLVGGSTELWRLLSNKFGWSYDTLQKSIPAIDGLLVGLSIVFIGVLLAIWLRRRGKTSPGAGALSLGLFLFLGLALAPTQILGGGKLSSMCAGDVIAAHEEAGAHLAALIPPGSLVYWENNVSPLPLLYIPRVRVFGPQLNHWYTYLEGGDPEVVYRNGYWNEELRKRWTLEADYLLVAENYAVAWQERLNTQYPGMFDQLMPTPNVVPCRNRAIIHIFRRMR